MGSVVPVRPYLVEHGAFTPEDVTLIMSAFEDCLTTLGLTKPSDPTVLVVAKRVIELAKLGIVSPTDLRDQVLRSFNLSLPN